MENDPICSLITPPWRLSVEDKHSTRGLRVICFGVEMDRATLDQLEVQERMQDIAMQISHIEEDNSECYVEDIDITPNTLENDNESDNGVDVTPHAIELQNITPENNSYGPYTLLLRL